MRLKEKIIIQTVICCAIFTLIKCSDMVQTETIVNARNTIDGWYNKNYTAQEIMDAGSSLLEKAKDVPANLASAVMSANEIGKYGQPIDEESTDSLQNVRAVYGGVVLASGINKEHGLYVKISHGNKVSVYGNLAEAKAITGERVKKSDVIGVYDKREGRDFYYTLQNKNGEEKIKT